MKKETKKFVFSIPVELFDKIKEIALEKGYITAQQLMRPIILNAFDKFIKENKE